jgi:hypothetical protein
MSLFEVQQTVSPSESLSPLTHCLPFRPRVKFSPGEDERLRNLVETLGTSDWHAIVAQMPGKNARQCKERWINYLSPELNTGAWTCEEDILLIRKHAELGPKWVQIAAFFPNRTDSMIKNRFNKLQRRDEKRRELLLRGELSFALPFFESMLTAIQSAPPDPVSVVEAPEAAAPIHEDENDFSTDVWHDSFGFTDELFEI